MDKNPVSRNTGIISKEMKQAKNIRKPGEYQAYLIRLWRDSDQEPWRAMAKQVSTGREIHFDSPEKLFLFLHAQICGEGLDVGEW